MAKQVKEELVIAGFGGQGVILSGQIIGKAACIFEGLYSTMIQSFGPEARGGSCSAQVVISNSPIIFPYVKQSDILVVMSQESYKKFAPRVKPDGIILYESDIVKPEGCEICAKQFGIPATKIAEEIRSKILLNIVMTGFFSAFCNFLSAESIKKSILDSVPKGTEEFNIRAFEKGYEKGIEAKK